MNKPLTKKEWEASIAETWSACIKSTYQDLIDAAVKAEREACAKLAATTVCDTHIPTGVKIYGTVAAKAIRERGNT
jgi:hypothetical protein